MNVSVIQQLCPVLAIGPNRVKRSRGRKIGRTLRYSFVISWYCAFMVFGAGRAMDRVKANRINETPMAMETYLNIILPSPGGGRERGPWGPNAIQYAKIGSISLPFHMKGNVEGFLNPLTASGTRRVGMT